MRRTAAALGAAGLLLLLLLAGCQPGRRKVVAVIPKGTAHIFWVAVRQGAEDAGRKFGVEILWNGPQNETEYGRQIQIVDSMIARRVDGIALAASERKALTQVLDRAAAAGIPVSIFDSGLDWEGYVSFVATDNVEAGRMAARKLAELLGGRGTVGIILHAPGSYSTMDREKGFEEVLRKQYPEIRIVARQYAMADRARAVAAAENILTAHPALDGIFASSEPSASGISLPLKARGRGGKTKFVAFDSSESMIEDLRAGVISAIVVQDPYEIGFRAVSTLVDKLEGRKPPRKIDLPARVVTAGELEHPEVRKLLRLER